MIDELDRSLPDTPKVLLCGAAAGVDLAAVRVVLEERMGIAAHPSWSVVLVLPFERELFERDFAGADFADDLRYLHELYGRVEPGGRVNIKQLRPLHQSKFNDAVLEDADAPRVDMARLADISADDYRQARRDCFEQLGLWLARYATILIAALPAEANDPAHTAKPGSSARAVAARRTATPDPTAAAVIERSSELLAASPFEEPDGGYVLWIDPTAAGAGGRLLPGVLVLRPIQRMIDVRQPKESPEQTRATIYAAPMSDEMPAGRKGLREHHYRCRGALALAHAFQRWHRRRRAYRGLSGPVPAATMDATHPASFLAQVRDGDLGRQQLASARRTRLAQRWSAALFFLSVTSYEAYVELLQDSPLLLALYIALLVAIWVIAEGIALRRVQSTAEDYRGLREMMRVQIAWWSAGIDRMVDRVHLRTIDTDLRLVREAAAAVSIWALLRCTRRQDCDIGAIERETADVAAADIGRHHARNWIHSQAEYFFRNVSVQLGATYLSKQSFHIALITALTTLGGLAVLLSVDKLPQGAAAVAGLLGVLSMPALLGFPVLVVLAAMGLLWLMTGHPLGGWRLEPGASQCWRVRRRVLGGAMIVAAVAIGIGVARRNFGVAAAVLSDNLGAALAWFGAAAFALVSVLAVYLRIADAAVVLNVRRLRWWQNVLAVVLLVVLVLDAAIAFTAPEAGAGTYTAESVRGFRSLILVQAVLLLTGAAGVRWHTDRRNHLALATHYDDMLRVFRRAEDWLDTRPAPLDREARQRLVDLGELALDEGEAWLKAHRERPAEPIA